MLINELHEKLRRIADTENKRADSGRISVTAVGVGAFVAVTLIALLSYIGYTR